MGKNDFRAVSAHILSEHYLCSTEYCRQKSGMDVGLGKTTDLSWNYDRDYNMDLIPRGKT